MSENLKTAHYSDGTEIPQNNAWTFPSSEPAYCSYVNDNTNKSTYGLLYNWYATYRGHLAPTGWHVADTSDWNALVQSAGGASVAAGKLKETGNSHWTNYVNTATNETGFTALPGGQRNGDAFQDLHGVGYWWTSTQDYSLQAEYYTITDTTVSLLQYTTELGFSVRCVKGE